MEMIDADALDGIAAALEPGPLGGLAVPLRDIAKRLRVELAPPQEQPPGQPQEQAPEQPPVQAPEDPNVVRARWLEQYFSQPQG